MATFRYNRVEPYFGFVRDGLKNVEVRLDKEKYSLIKAGDTVIVHETENNENIYTAQVLAVRKYKNLRNLFDNEDLSKTLPNAKSTDEAISIMRQFYNEEQEIKYGALAIQVTVKDTLQVS